MTYHLVLIGGGHSHAIALKLWGINPIPGVRVTLLSDTSHTPYSGMLPGQVAGFYSFEETHIDLRRLAEFAGVQFHLDRAIGLNLNDNQVICANSPPINFDFLSIDIGSTPSTISVPGATEYAIAAKPVQQFLQSWNQIIESVKNHPEEKLSISIVGGGAGGVELALNMQSHLQTLFSPDNLTLHLFHRDSQLLSRHSSWVSHRLEEIFSQRSILLHLLENVKKIEVQKESGSDRIINSPQTPLQRILEIRCESGLKVESNYIFWVTQASAPRWLKESGITTDSQGFILVGDTLQSVSHPHIFAAGDIATLENHPCPKAGVFAVRQGKPLFENLQSIIQGKSLKKYLPQKHYLSLIGTGDKKAIASWSIFGWESHLMWVWKDYIDRKFMRMFTESCPRVSVVSHHSSLS